MDESVVGISQYLTSAPGLGGRIKASAEDFVVDEVSMDLPRSEAGRYTAARIRTRNWETNRPVRPIAHGVGRHSVREEIREAVMAYVAHPIEGEDPEAFAVREGLESSGDYAAALKAFPREWGFEKAILNRLAANPEDFTGALQALP